MFTWKCAQLYTMLHLPRACMVETCASTPCTSPQCIHATLVSYVCYWEIESRVSCELRNTYPLSYIPLSLFWDRISVTHPDWTWIYSVAPMAWPCDLPASVSTVALLTMSQIPDPYYILESHVQCFACLYHLLDRSHTCLYRSWCLPHIWFHVHNHLFDDCIQFTTSFCWHYPLDHYWYDQINCIKS